ARKPKADTVAADAEAAEPVKKPRAPRKKAVVAEAPPTAPEPAPAASPDSEPATAPEGREA
ncbi:MAG: hypothetical protein J0H21_09560, partial [Rhizobiales bacterium]|nr:hypothetical protein [Hyphomicrobiales bacterium]